MASKYMTVKKVAEVTGVCRATVYEWVHTCLAEIGASYKLGGGIRIDRVKFERWILDGRVMPPRSLTGYRPSRIELSKTASHTDDLLDRAIKELQNAR